MSDIDAIGDLYRAERAVLARSLARLVGESEAEDLVHDAFVAYLVAGRSHPKPGAWLATVARNRALNHVVRMREVPLGVDVERPAADDPAEIVSRRWARTLVAGQLAMLPERAREALRLRFYEGLPYEEIALRLGVPAGRAHVIVHRALRRLGHALLRVVAEAGRSAECAPAVAAELGLRLRAPANHADEACTRCRSILTELRTLRSVWGLAALVGGVRRLRGRLLDHGSAAIEPAAHVVGALTAFAISVTALSPARSMASPPAHRLPARVLEAPAGTGLVQPPVERVASRPMVAAPEASPAAPPRRTSQQPEEPAVQDVKVDTPGSRTRVRVEDRRGSASVETCAPCALSSPDPSP